MALGRGTGPRRRGISPFKAGLIALVLVVIGSYFAYTQANPFSDPYEFTATFHSANNLRPTSPVRVAGVNVGEVKEVKPVDDGSGAAQVTMEMKDEGLPLHVDAELKIRPRIFLEGNFFVDLQQGTPSAPKLKDGGNIPVNQTATPVQFGQVLTALQSDTREDLKTFLDEYALKALKGGGAEAFNRSIRYWEPAYKNTALANEALLGQRPGDLHRVLRGQQKAFAALVEDPEALRDLVTNFNTTVAAFAREDDALEAAIPELRDVLAAGEPALRSLNSSFPGLRRFARDALPGVRSTGPMIVESFPFIQQLRRLFSQAELRGLVDDLVPTIPALARLNDRTVPLLKENRALARCQNPHDVPEGEAGVLDFADDPIPAEHLNGGPGSRPGAVADPDATNQPFYKQTVRSLIGLAGESRISDANSPLFRVAAGGGPGTFIRTGNFDQGVETFISPTFGTTQERAAPAPNPEGVEPGRPSFRPDVPCETQVKPDLRADVLTGLPNIDPTTGNPNPQASSVNRKAKAGTDCPPVPGRHELDEFAEELGYREGGAKQFRGQADFDCVKRMYDVLPKEQQKKLLFVLSNQQKGSKRADTKPSEDGR